MRSINATGPKPDITWRRESYLGCGNLRVVVRARMPNTATELPRSPIEMRTERMTK